jgi:hypothetical protein
VDDASVSRQGEVCGTPHYMAPEQVRGEPVDHRVDLFSLGSVLYVMCTGRLPFEADSTLAVLHRVCTDQPKPIRTCNPAVPDWLVGLIEALHAKDPNRRVQSAAEVKEALLAGCGRDSTTRVLRAVAKAPAQGPAPATLSVRTVLALLLGLVFLLSLPAFYLLTHREEKPAGERPVAQGPPLRQAPVVPPSAAPKGPEAPAPKPAAPKRPVGAPPPAPQRPEKAPAARPPAAPLKGVVIVRTNDPASAEFFRHEGLSARDQKTSRSLPLDQARNYLPLGEYTLDTPPPAVLQGLAAEVHRCGRPQRLRQHHLRSAPRRASGDGARPSSAGRPSSSPPAGRLPSATTAAPLTGANTSEP